ncbi:hypothetical protein Adu01nite_65020 [Paractinoplanes durhamensis]|uniref:Uncharacterized protein n=1 Tax=Paractinoplanes durhamensis TaxID=113563 RepID=A0ABQ3Z5P8_9ACTN|nr:hypothetical protein Adu01nite_65020 [Actinoplanes durhamensis]
MFELPDPFTLLMLARLVEETAVIVAVGVSLWSRSPSRREAARRVIRALRQGEEDADDAAGPDDPGEPDGPGPRPKPSAPRGS